VGTAGSFSIRTSGYPAAVVSEAGVLPSGVTFNPSTNILSGTPVGGTGGTYPISFTASNGIGTNAVQNFTLTVRQAPAITSPNSITFPVATADTFTVTATGFPIPTLTETLSMPSWLTFTNNRNGTGTLKGTPPAGSSGSYNLSFTASNGVGSNSVQGFTLTVQ
jgi:large repetitive protein